MHLTPQELDKLILHQAGFLAQKRLARGLLLNVPEAIALISMQILEQIREGKTVAELMDWGRKLLGYADVMEGVPEMVSEVQIEGTFPDGSKLVTVHHPIVGDFGDLSLALYGSFLPIPNREIKDRLYTNTRIPGEIFVKPGELLINEGRETKTLEVCNRGDRPIQVGSHYPFFESNRALSFNRGQSYGMRLNIPAGTAVRFEPGETKTVTLVSIGGNRILSGGNALAEGPLSEHNRAKALANANERGFQ
jgi:urease subunit gamma/beta